MSEHLLVQQILIEFGSRPGLRIWRNNTGAAKRRTGGLVRFGVPGMPDIMGVLAPLGRLICVECKTATGRQSDAQKKWQAMAMSHGVPYGLVRNMDEARAYFRALGVA